MEDDRYPLPVLKDVLMSLGSGNQIFSSLDLLSGYWQVSMAEESQEITVFSTSGHYYFLRMPFDLKSASLTSQGMMNTFFPGMLRNSVFAYLDDLVISSKIAESHSKNLH